MSVERHLGMGLYTPGVRAHLPSDPLDAWRQPDAERDGMSYWNEREDVL